MCLSQAVRMEICTLNRVIKSSTETPEGFHFGKRVMWQLRSQTS